MNIGPSTVASGDTLTFYLTRTDDGDVTFADHDHTLFLDDYSNLESKFSEHDIVEAECLVKKAVWAHSGGTHMLFVEVESCSVVDPDYMHSDAEDDTTATQPEDNTTEETQNQNSSTTGKPQTPPTESSGSTDSENTTETNNTNDCPADEENNEPTVQPVEWDSDQPLRPHVLRRILNHGEHVPDPTRTDELTYAEQTAIEIEELITDLAKDLEVSAAVCYQTGEVYAKAMRSDLLQGKSKIVTAAAAFRIATLLEKEHRPLAAIEASLNDSFGEDVTTSSLSHQQRKLLANLDIDSSVILIQPQKYLPYLAHNLGLEEDSNIIQEARSIASHSNTNGGTSPWSITAAAVYAAGLQPGIEKLNQKEIADAAYLTEVTIRNNYKELMAQ